MERDVVEAVEKERELPREEGHQEGHREDEDEQLGLDVADVERNDPAQKDAGEDGHRQLDADHLDEPEIHPAARYDDGLADGNDHGEQEDDQHVHDHGDAQHHLGEGAPRPALVDDRDRRSRRARHGKDAQEGCDGHHLGHRSTVQKRQQRSGDQHECCDAEKHDDRQEQDGQEDAPSPLSQLPEPQFAARGQGDEGQGQVVDELQLLDRSGVDELECVGSEKDPGQDVSGDLRNLEMREDIPDEIGGQQQKTEGHGRPGVCENGGITGAEERQHHEEDDGDQPEDADHGVISRAVRSTLFAREGLTSSFRITASNTVVTTALLSSVELSW